MDAAAPAPVTPGAAFERLRDPAVRDLGWLLFGPSLLREVPPLGRLARPFDTPLEAADMLAWLQSQDRAPLALHRHLAAARHTRMGRYAECLLGWFLREGPVATLIAANVPVRRAGRTLGECDFLLETSRGRRLHWELAVKCYLHTGDARGRLADYVGPNLQDRFDRKLARLLDHQLPLSTREEFARLGHAGPWQAQMLVRGWLFYRHGEPPPPAALPVELDPAHARGWWLTRAEWPAFADGDGRERLIWRVLPRLEWLAPRGAWGGAVPPEPTAATSALLAEPERQPGPVMMAGFAPDGRGGWREHSRGFVVPDEWPAQAAIFAGE